MNFTWTPYLCLRAQNGGWGPLVSKHVAKYLKYFWPWPVAQWLERRPWDQRVAGFNSQ